MISCGVFKDVSSMRMETCAHASKYKIRHKLQLGLAQEAEQFAAQFPF